MAPIKYLDSSSTNTEISTYSRGHSRKNNTVEKKIKIKDLLDKQQI